MAPLPACTKCLRRVFCSMPHSKAELYNARAFFLLLAAAVGALLATLARDGLEAYISAQVLAHVILASPSAGGYAAYMDSTDPDAGAVTSSFRVFNVTNPDEVLAGGRPNVDELGPLRYRYTQRRTNATWSEGGDLLSYGEYQFYVPLDEATRELEKAELTTPNLLLLAALNTPGLAELIPLDLQTLNPSLLFVRKTAREVLWGYNDSTSVPGLPLTFPGLQHNDSSSDDAWAQHGVNRMYTGAHDTGSAYGYVQWDGMSDMECCASGPAGEAGAAASGGCAPLWSSYEAGTIRGTYGSNFPPFVDPSADLRIATYDFGIFRSWPLHCDAGGPGPGVYNDGSPFTAAIGGCASYTVKDVRLLKYALPPWVLGNASVSAEEAAGYGVTGPSGVIDVSSCEQRAPILLSRPHFLHASDSLRAGVTGLSEPSEEEHGSVLGIEPITGQSLDFHFRVGINARLQPINVTVLGLVVQFWPGIADTVLPLAWGEQASSMTDTQATTLKGSVYTGVAALVSLRWGGVVLAVVSLAAALAFHVLGTRAARPRKAAGVEGAAWDGEEDWGYSTIQ